MSIRRRISPDQGRRALAAWKALGEGDELDRQTMATAVRFAAEEFAERHPGGAVEVRIPPFIAVQAIEGPKHSRGTPPNVVECQPETWLQLVTGRASFADEAEAGRVQASGTRSDLSAQLPLASVD